MNLLLKTVSRFPVAGLRAPSRAWPGAYTISYYDLRNGDVVCAKCASFERFRTKLAADVHWEGPAEYCACCNAELPAEYGDPEEL